jgi:DMSO/TMAO reductase YedYZ molybdopterin-dependent catalytic subunit
MIKGSTLDDLWPNFLALGAPLRLRVENELGFKMVKRRIRWKWA